MPLSFEHLKLGWQFPQNMTRKKQHFVSKKLLKLVYKAFIDVSLYTVQGTWKVSVGFLAFKDFLAFEDLCLEQELSPKVVQFVII